MASDDIDYRELLVKYMIEVLEAEGVSFRPTVSTAYAAYSDEELAVLAAIEQEAVERYARARRNRLI